MKKSVLKMAMVCAAMFMFGNTNIQNCNSISEDITNSSFINKENALKAGIIPPIKPTGPKKLVQEIPDIYLQIQKI